MVGFILKNLVFSCQVPKNRINLKDVRRINTFPVLSNRGSFEVVRPKVVSGVRHVPPDIHAPSYWKHGIPSSPPIFPDIKSGASADMLRKSCRLASQILHSLKTVIKVGMTTDEIDQYVHEECLKHKAYPSPLNYRGYPKSVCTSVNNVAIHGIPDSRKLVDGDIINVDITVFLNGFHGDCSAMFLIGNVDDRGKALVAACHQALHEAIAVVGPKVHFSEIGKAIESVADSTGFHVIPNILGHGIGTYFHGPPDIYHVDKRNFQGQMEIGMSFTIEPVFSDGSTEVTVLDDGWTTVTEDNSRTAQWEHTILVTQQGAEILTAPLKES